MEVKLSKEDVLKCRLCRVRKGEHIFVNKPAPTKFYTRLRMRCNQCNTERVRKHRENNKERHYEITRKYDFKNPDKRASWGKVKYAIDTGVLIRPDKCQLCNKKAKIDAHHKDYSKPLEVTFVCKACHNAIHKGVLII
jgi:hypothetical protein